MSFIVETGAGLANSNSYASVADADAYVADYATTANQTAWSALNTAAKELALRQGTLYLENKYKNRWVERRTSQDQRLAWPRAYVIDSDGFAVESDVVPEAIRNAAIEAAIISLTVDLLAPVETGSIESIREEVGPLKSEIVYAVPTPATPWYRKIDLTLKDFINESGMVERG